MVYCGNRQLGCIQPYYYYYYYLLLFIMTIVHNSTDIRNNERKLN